MRFPAGKTLCALVAAALLSVAQADAKDRIWPPPGGGCVPRLGFNSYFNGWGEHVTSVNCGSLAWSIGLEAGDTIVAVNGMRLTYDGAWYQAMAQAAAQGHVVLAIRDWRTGGMAYRHINLGGPVVTPKAPRR